MHRYLFFISLFAIYFSSAAQTYYVNVPVYDTVMTRNTNQISRGSDTTVYNPTGEIIIDQGLITKMPAGISLYFKILSSQLSAGCLKIKNVGVMNVGDSILMTATNNRFEWSSLCGNPGMATYGIFAVGTPVLAGDSFFCKSQWSGTVAMFYQYHQSWFSSSGIWPFCSVIAPLNVSTINSSDQLRFSIYPNPSDGNITISSSESFLGMEIINLLGEIVYRPLQQTVNTKSVNIGFLPKGIYLVQIKDKENNVSATCKLILQ